MDPILIRDFGKGVRVLRLLTDNPPGQYVLSKPFTSGSVWSYFRTKHAALRAASKLAMEGL